MKRQMRRYQRNRSWLIGLGKGCSVGWSVENRGVTQVEGRRIEAHGLGLLPLSLQIKS